MNLDNLKKMMLAIEQNQPIHLPRFKELVGQLHLSHRIEATDIRGIKFRGDRYWIDYINPIIKKEIQTLIASLGHDRISAAKQNLSHQHKVSGSLLLIRQQVSLSETPLDSQVSNHLQEFGHPQVIVFDEHGNFETPICLSKQAVIVENRQIFLNIQKMHQFLIRYTQVPCTEKMDYIFGTGNEIANSLHQKFLAEYQHLYLCFDCDLGGLKIAKNVHQLLPNTTMTFLQPHDLPERLAQVVQNCSSEELEQLAKFSIDAPAFIQPYVQLICNAKRHLEQESFLI